MITEFVLLNKLMRKFMKYLEEKMFDDYLTFLYNQEDEYDEEIEPTKQDFLQFVEDNEYKYYEYLGVLDDDYENGKKLISSLYDVCVDLLFDEKLIKKINADSERVQDKRASKYVEEELKNYEYCYIGKKNPNCKLDYYLYYLVVKHKETGKYAIFTWNASTETASNICYNIPTKEKLDKFIINKVVVH